MAQKPIVTTQSNQSTAKLAGKVAPGSSFAREDLLIVRKAAITLGVSLVLAASLFGVSRYVLSLQEANKLQAQTELMDAQTKFTAATNQKNDIRDYQQKYIQLVQSGFVAQEKRLDTIEQIYQIQENRKLLPIVYEIYPQQIAVVDPAIQTGELEIHGSKIQLRMRLLHEMDLLNFVSDLNSRGVFSPQSCSIKPNDSVRDSAIAAQLQAECTLYWITIGPKVAADGTAPLAATATQ
ncbi:hypothetical protein [Undibacterium sp. RuTC16W]|uniref:hypothetical protein n=1 Tax=Undibacterium sp. RuTC16W TaxID=3413048 RepID=UPI003BF3940E